MGTFWKQLHVYCRQDILRRSFIRKGSCTYLNEVCDVNPRAAADSLCVFMGLRVWHVVRQLAVPGGSPRASPELGCAVCGIGGFSVRHGRGAGGQPVPHVPGEEEVCHRWEPDPQKQLLLVHSCLFSRVFCCQLVADCFRWSLQDCFLVQFKTVLYEILVHRYCSGLPALLFGFFFFTNCFAQFFSAS